MGRLAKAFSAVVFTFFLSTCGGQGTNQSLSPQTTVSAGPSLTIQGVLDPALQDPSNTAGEEYTLTYTLYDEQGNVIGHASSQQTIPMNGASFMISKFTEKELGVPVDKVATVAVKAEKVKVEGTRTALAGEKIPAPSTMAGLSFQVDAAACAPTQSGSGGDQDTCLTMTLTNNEQTLVNILIRLPFSFLSGGDGAQSIFCLLNDLFETFFTTACNIIFPRGGGLNPNGELCDDPLGSLFCPDNGGSNQCNNNGVEKGDLCDEQAQPCREGICAIAKGTSSCTCGVSSPCGDGTCEPRAGECDTCPQDCRGNPACTAPQPEICNNDIDDDGDGSEDCKDSDCATDPACAPSCQYGACDGKCQNGCDRSGLCCNPPPSAPDCSDGFVEKGSICDNQSSDPASICGRGLVCKVKTFSDNSMGCRCLLPTEAGSCSDGIDNDDNGFTDCADADCSSDPFCSGPPNPCGDGFCDGKGGEDCNTCSADCGSCPPPNPCGDRFCDSRGGEDCSTCEVDCGPCGPPPGPCGDGFCDGNGGEDCNTCSADCGPCAPPPGDICGDTICGATETCSTCDLDCGTCPAPPGPK